MSRWGRAAGVAQLRGEGEDDVDGDRGLPHCYCFPLCFCCSASSLVLPSCAAAYAIYWKMKGDGRWWWRSEQKRWGFYSSLFRFLGTEELLRNASASSKISRHRDELLVCWDKLLVMLVTMELVMLVEWLKLTVQKGDAGCCKVADSCLAVGVHDAVWGDWWQHYPRWLILEYLVLGRRLTVARSCLKWRKLLGWRSSTATHGAEIIAANVKWRNHGRTVVATLNGISNCWPCSWAVGETLGEV